MRDPLFTFVLCFSLWLRSGETSDFQSFFDLFGQYCLRDCPKKHFTSTYDLPCIDSCDKRGYDYYWCKSRKGWDYCSPSNNVDYQGYTCDTRYPCDNYGENHLECYLRIGVWDKCARVEPRAMIYYTRDRKECIEECLYHESGGYFWCYTEDDWDYCSPLPDHTYRNEPCRPDHDCRSYGQSYTWCYTTYNNNWDWCGIISPGECVFTQTHRAKRQTNNPRVICTREDDDDNNNRRVTTFKDVGGQQYIKKPNKKLLNEALELINRWNNQRLSAEARSNLITSDHLRLDNQGLCNRNNQRCYNLQIQINGPRSPGQSTTVAQIIVPVDTSAEYMRFAFRESLRGNFRVELEVNNEPTPSPNNNLLQERCCKRKKKKDYNANL
ncbi:uncharacterized protein LOC133010086 isoform X2 [Limanda limanda]|nr:uncharacterized protein LOC133010086 isoform X2 [Limanda limanda]